MIYVQNIQLYSISSEELLNVAPNLVINLLVCFDNAAQSRLWVFCVSFRLVRGFWGFN